MRRLGILLLFLGSMASAQESTTVSVVGGGENYVAVQANVDGLWGFRVGRIDECEVVNCRTGKCKTEGTAGVYEAVVFVPVHKRWGGWVSAGVADYDDDLDATGGLGMTFTYEHLAVTGGYQSAAGAVGGLGWSAEW